LQHENNKPNNKMKTKMKKTEQFQTINAFAFARGLDSRTVARRLQKEGVTPHHKKARWRVYDVSVMEALMQPTDSSVVADGEEINPKTERALKLRAERKCAELEYAKSIGEVVSMSKVQPLIFGMAKMVRARLRQIPDRTAQKYSLMTDPLEIKHDLIIEIDNALRSMAEFDMEQFKKEALEDARKG
jgi:phage terminase Nu1 subunit (DNA packaging protein)